MAKTATINLPSGERIPIIHEDRWVIAIDKPARWLLAPANWRGTSRNLQAALERGIAQERFWATCRNLRYLRFVHRLDAETTGVLLLARERATLHSLSRLFESRQVEKTYLAVVRGIPGKSDWLCQSSLADDTERPGMMKVDLRHGKDAETLFRVLETHRQGPLAPYALIEARPLTGRTHQIRVHLAASGHPVVGDSLYGGLDREVKPTPRLFPLALRAISLAYRNPADKRPVADKAPSRQFLESYGFPAP
jgi:RluA family pseudouridine synthase